MKKTWCLALLAASMASLVLLRGGALADDGPPADPPKLTNPDDVLDEQEDAIMAAETVLDDYRIGVTQMTPDRILAAFSDDFEGDTIFQATETKAQTVGYAAIAARGPLPTKKAGLPDAIDAFFRSVDVVTLYVTKVAQATRNGDETELLLKNSLQARKGTGLIHIQEKFKTRIKNGKIVSQKRLDGGRRVESTRPIFQDATDAMGVSIPPSFDCHFCTYNDFFTMVAGGVAVADFDGDGLLDFFVTGPARSYLFRNTGDGRFEDVTEKAGLSGAAGNGALWFDYDGDGRLDLLVTRYCGPDAVHERCSSARKGWCGGKGCAVQLYRNKGDGTFENVTERAGLNVTGPAMSACVGDFDHDGNLDIFVGLYGWAIPSQPPDPNVYRQPIDPPGPSPWASTNAPPKLLFRNKGDGTFEEVAKKAGVADTNWTLACGFVDLRGDGWPDLYVVNDYGENVLHRNRKNGTFEVERRPGFDCGMGMGLARGDFWGDGAIDLYVSKMYSTAGTRIADHIDAHEGAPSRNKIMRKFVTGNTLLRNDGNGNLSDASEGSGATTAGWAWGTVACDYDNDGRPDIYVANGFISSASRRDL